jgi:tetratricopeptide (TPR) repeat protein
LRRAAQLQPSSVLTTVNLAYGLLEQGDSAAALEQAKRAVEMAPDHPTASIILVYAAQAMNRPDAARAALAQAQKAAAGNPHSLSMVAVALARFGRREESVQVARELDEVSRTQYVSPYDLGKVSLVLGDEERAFGFFDEAVRQRSSGVIFLRNVRGCVRDTPRFDSLVNQLHLQG